MIAVSTAAIVLVLRPDTGSSDNGTATATEESEFASANDTGPANLITEDPTCEAWGGIARDYASKTESAGWGERDALTPASDWTPQQRAMFETVGQAMTSAAEPTANLARQTPHRVVRELYGQFIAYADVFVAAIPSYDENARAVANVTNSVLSGLSAICSSIDYRSAQAQAPLVPKVAAPAAVSPPDVRSSLFLPDDNSACAEWITSTEQYDEDIAGWIAVDPKIAAADWTPEQKSVYEQVSPIMSARADEIERLGRQSENPVFEDFAVLTAQYLRAYVLAIPRYTSRDNSLTDVVRYVTSAVYWACKATA